jgi:pheromone shutdown protein TraB
MDGSRKTRDEDLAERLQEYVYGTISTLVVIGALEGDELGRADSATIVVIGTAVATWLAHSFAAIIGLHIRERRPVRVDEMTDAFRGSWRIITAALPATALLVLANMNTISLRVALATATLSGVVQLVWVGIFAAKRSEFSLLGVVVYAATATAIGLLIVAIEIAAFH